MHEGSPFDVIPNMNAPVIQSATRGLFEKCIEMKQPVELLSSSHGEIKSLLVTIPVPYLEENKAPYTLFIDVIKELAQKFPGRQLTLLAETRKEHPNERESSKIDSIKRAAMGAELLVLTTTKADDSFSLWAQDAFLTAQARKADAGVIIAPDEHQRNNRSNDGSIAKEVVALHPAGYTFIEFSMPTEGGNVLVADDFILVGKDEIEHSGYSEEQFVKNFTAVFGKGKPVIFVSAENIPQRDIEEDIDDDILERSTILIHKNDKQYKHEMYRWRGTEQPIFHIDVFITLLGRNELDQQLILIGEPIAGFENTNSNGETHKVLTYQLEDATRRIDECIQNLERDLKKHNIQYKILRNPLPLTYYTYGLKTSWYWASYNNCIVEIAENGQKTAWLPSYHNPSYSQNKHWEHLKKYDNKNVEIFRENGFTTHLFKNDFHFLANKNGSLHCMTKCLNRSNMLRRSQITRAMLNVKFRLHNDDGTYTVDINNDGEIIKVPIENPKGTAPINTRGIMLKAPENSSKLKIKEGKILHNPILSVQMLIESDRKYVENVNIIDIDSEPVVALIGNEHYRELRLGQKEFNYSLKNTWVSLHVIKSDEDGVPVYYLVINSSPD